MEPLLVLASLAAAVVCAVAVGMAVLGQVQRAAMHVSQPVQFYLTDFAWLLVQLQVALALITRYDFGADWANRMVLAFFAGALAAMWWGAVRSLSQAGVRGLLRRAVFILVVLPAVETLMVLGALAYGLGPVFALNVHRGEFIVFAHERPGIGEILVWAACAMLAIAGALTIACLLLRWLTRWVLADPAASGSAVAAAGASR